MSPEALIGAGIALAGMFGTYVWGLRDGILHERTRIREGLVTLNGIIQEDLDRAIEKKRRGDQS